ARGCNTSHGLVSECDNNGVKIRETVITARSWFLLPGNIHMFSNVARDTHYYPRRHRQERAWTQEQEEEENRPQNSYSAFLQLMPVFIIIVVSVITQLMATNPPYSLFYKSSIGHVISRETENLQVPYYVDKNFEKNYQGAELQELEKTVEKDYIDYIQTSCWKEKQQ
ncbi:PREDICTED: dnaJ homolog subfamily C member 18-like, partial [Buceros rhinoceros silvestris]|uniref:dnaJ homolog subfamily C member 18-like n=1 Tax=Buceros rhinoceros silvestris TaxID=175836 RepID=UPI0005285874